MPIAYRVLTDAMEIPEGSLPSPVYAEPEGRRRDCHPPSQWEAVPAPPDCRGGRTILCREPAPPPSASIRKKTASLVVIVCTLDA